MALVPTVSMAVGLYAAQRLLEPLFGASSAWPRPTRVVDGAVAGNVALVLVRRGLVVPRWIDETRTCGDDRCQGASAWLTRLESRRLARSSTYDPPSAGRSSQTVASALIGQPDCPRPTGRAVRRTARMPRRRSAPAAWSCSPTSAGWRRSTRSSRSGSPRRASTRSPSTTTGGRPAPSVAVPTSTTRRTHRRRPGPAFGPTRSAGAEHPGRCSGPCLVGFLFSWPAGSAFMRGEAARAGTSALADRRSPSTGRSARRRNDMPAAAGATGVHAVAPVLAVFGGDDYIRREVVSCSPDPGRFGPWVARRSAIVARRTTSPSTERLATHSPSVPLEAFATASSPSCRARLRPVRSSTPCSAVASLGPDLAVPLAADRGVRWWLPTPVASVTDVRTRRPTAVGMPCLGSAKRAIEGPPIRAPERRLDAPCATRVGV